MENKVKEIKISLLNELNNLYQDINNFSQYINRENKTKLLKKIENTILSIKKEYESSSNDIIELNNFLNKKIRTLLGDFLILDPNKEYYANIKNIYYEYNKILETSNIDKVKDIDTSYNYKNILNDINNNVLNILGLLNSNFDKKNISDLENIVSKIEELFNDINSKNNEFLIKAKFTFLIKNLNELFKDNNVKVMEINNKLKNNKIKEYSNNIKRILINLDKSK